MKSLCFFVTVLLVASGISLAAGYVQTGKAGDYSVRVTFDKSRPVLGPNRLEIRLTDSAGRPVAGAQVKVDYLMPSLPGRPPMMEYSTTAKPVGTEYEATMDLTMKGLWKMVFSITAGQQTEKETFDFEVK